MDGSSAPEPVGRKPWHEAVLLAAGILLASIVPLPRRGAPAFGPYGPDKFLHVVGHAWLARAIGVTLSGRASAPGVALVAAVLSTAHGVVVEVLQDRLPGRVSEPADRRAAALGSVLGAAVWVWDERR